MKLNQRAQWEVLPQASDEYLSVSGLPPVIAQLMYNRGVKLDEIELFLAADHRLEGNPFLLPDIAQAISRIYKALLSEEKIAIYGDFDVDGITATAILVEGLSWLGGQVIPYIPDRLEEGHGLNFSAMEKIHAQGTNLVITVDCGVTDLKEVRRAREMGMDVIITDHHLPSKSLPQAIAVIDPKREDSVYPYSDLSGAGVAFKLLQALLHKDSREERLTELLDLVVLSTIADLVPVVGENRYLVKAGLKELNSTRRIGIQEMVKLAGLKLGELDSEDISWTLGPRINAASRMDNASTGYQLLTTHSPEEAHLLAVELGEKNAERQKLTSEILSRVKERLGTKMHLPLLIEGDENYPVGVIGLVAGKLVDEFYKPAIILNLDSEECRGSCRSIPEFNIVSALEKCQDLLFAFGGHPLAAGFTLARKDLDEMEKRIVELARDQLAHLDLRPKLLIDAELPLATFTGDIFNFIRKLSPYGRGNSQPVFLTRQVEVVDCRNFGNQSKWVELKLKQGDIAWSAVDFNSQMTVEEIPSYIDVVYSIGKGWWNGERALRLNLHDFTPSQARC